jgi:nucleoside-diphosphate-sugar epimerase
MNLVVGNRTYDIAKAKKDLGYKPKYDMKSGFKETVEYFKNQLNKNKENENKKKD